MPASFPSEVPDWSEEIVHLIDGDVRALVQEDHRRTIKLLASIHPVLGMLQGVLQDKRSHERQGDTIRDSQA